MLENLPTRHFQVGCKFSILVAVYTEKSTAYKGSTYMWTITLDILTAALIEVIHGPLQKWWVENAKDHYFANSDARKTNSKVINASGLQIANNTNLCYLNCSKFWGQFVTNVSAASFFNQWFWCRYKTNIILTHNVVHGVLYYRSQKGSRLNRAW